MQKNVSAIIASVACVLLAFNSFKIISLQEELDRLRSDMNDEIHTVNRNIDEIYGDVQEMLDEEVNQLAVSEWEYGNIDIDARTAEVICTIVPKIYTPNVTRAVIVCNENEYNLTYVNGKYTATIELPLFDRNEINMVKLNDNGTIRMQELDWVIEPRHEVLLISHAGAGGSAPGKPGDGEYIWSPEYTVVIDIQSKVDFQIKSAELVEILDGKEVNCISIDLSNEGQDAYIEELRKTDEPIPEVALRANEVSGATFKDNLNFVYCLDKDYHIPNGSMLELYVDVVDGNDLRYRSFVECLAVTNDGELDDLRMEETQMYAFAEAVMIFDEADNVIFEISPELFK